MESALARDGAAPAAPAHTGNHFFKRFSSLFLPPEVSRLCGRALTACANGGGRRSGFGVAFLFPPQMHCRLCFQDQIAYLCFQAFLPGNQIIRGFAGCPLPWSPRLSPVTNVGLFVSAFPCSQMLLWSLNGGGRAAFETVCSASRALARSLAGRCREVLRALNTGCRHLSACLKRYLANLISCPKNRPGSCSHSSKGGCTLESFCLLGF